MTSPAKIRANRRNACKSTGPRTRAGKAIVARNARTHGLNIPAICGGFAGDLVALAREIEVSVTGAEADAAGHELACRVAETIIDIGRVRLAKLPLVAALEADPNDRPALRQLCRLGRYEARALVRRRRAIRDFDAVALPLRAAKQSQRRNTNDIRQCAQPAPLAQPHPEERSQRERVSKGSAASTSAAPWFGDRRRGREIAKQSQPRNASDFSKPAARRGARVMRRPISPLCRNALSGRPALA